MKTKIAFILIFCLILTACTRLVQPPTEPQVTLEKDIGDEFEIVLESDYSAGAHWEIVGGLDRKRVDLLNRYYQSAGDSGSGVEIFIFRAAGLGETVITLSYYVPGDTQPEETRIFTVDVDDD